MVDKVELIHEIVHKAAEDHPGPIRVASRPIPKARNATPGVGT